MADISHVWGNDLIIDDCGDILWANGTTEVSQRLVRRFLTNPITFNAQGKVLIKPDYIFEPTYGGGARTYVDALYSPTLAASVQRRLLDQIAEEPLVAATPAPVVQVGQIQGGMVVNASVTLADGTVALIPQLSITA